MEKIKHYRQAARDRVLEMVNDNGRDGVALSAPLSEAHRLSYFNFILLGSPLYVGKPAHLGALVLLSDLP